MCRGGRSSSSSFPIYNSGHGFRWPTGRITGRFAALARLVLLVLIRRRRPA